MGEKRRFRMLRFLALLAAVPVIILLSIPVIMDSSSVQRMLSHWISDKFPGLKPGHVGLVLYPLPGIVVSEIEITRGAFENIVIGRTVIFVSPMEMLYRRVVIEKILIDNIDVSNIDDPINAAFHTINEYSASYRERVPDIPAAPGSFVISEDQGTHSDGYTHTNGQTHPDGYTHTNGQTHPDRRTHPDGRTHLDIEIRNLQLPLFPLADIRLAISPEFNEIQAVVDIKDQGDVKDQADVKDQGDVKDQADVKDQGDVKDQADVKDRVPLNIHIKYSGSPSLPVMHIGAKNIAISKYTGGIFRLFPQNSIVETIFGILGDGYVEELDIFFRQESTLSSLFNPQNMEILGKLAGGSVSIPG
ncbi:MAG: hypothetical protein HQK66_03480, partial [Desulfamplus sp.]|nr:hypothetical protein [Desulfamplus sp.]